MNYFKCNLAFKITILIFSANRLPLNMEVFLRGKEEMQEIIDEEVKALSSTIEDDKKNSKQTNKSIKKENNKTDGGSVDNLPECRVKVKRTDISTVNNCNTDNDDDENESFTDFQRADGNTEKSSSTSPKKRDNAKRRTRKRHLRISDDSD